MKKNKHLSNHINIVSNIQEDTFKMITSKNLNINTTGNVNIIEWVF